MKKFISRRDFLKVAGAVGAAGALAACGGSSSSSTAASTATSAAAGGSSEGGVSISLWTYPIGSWGGTESKLDDIIAAFNAVHPEITVTYETLDYQNGDNLVTSAITAKETPDLIMEGPERLVSNWGANNLMVDLSDLWADTKDDIAAVSESVVSACQLDGAYYEYPLCMTTHCMAINYEVFEQAGALQYLDEETRTWTTDDFVAAMETIRDSGLTAVPGRCARHPVLRRPGRRPGHPRAGQQPLLRYIHQPRTHRVHRQQPRERQGSGAAQEHGGQPQPERQRRLPGIG